MPNLSTITPMTILQLFLVLRFVQHIIETWLARKNKDWWSDKNRQADASQSLGISAADMEKTAKYSKARYGLSRVHAVTDIIVSTFFIGFGGLGYTESIASRLTSAVNGGAITQGLLFIGLLTFMSQLVNLPFSIYSTFIGSFGI